MSASEIINQAKAAGVRLYVEDGRLCCEGEDSALDALEPVFRAHKTELLAVLSQKPRASRSAIPLPTKAQQKATLETYATKAGSAGVRETARQELVRMTTPESGERTELTPNLKRAVAMTQEVFSSPPKPQPNDGLSPAAREALRAIRKIAGGGEILDALSVADAMQVSVTAISGALVELERMRLIHPGNWSRCGTKIRLVTH